MEVPSQIVVLGTIAVCFPPIDNTLRNGQVNHFVLLLLMLFWVLRKEGKDVGAGIALGVAVVIKMSPALLAAYVALRREWKLLGIGVAAGAALWGFAILAAGMQPTVSFFVNALPALGYGGAPEGLFPSDALWNASWNGLSARIGLALGLPGPPTTLVAYAAVLWILIRTGRVLGSKGAPPRGEDDVGVAAVVVLMLLLSSWTYHHHLVMLIPVLALLFWEAGVAVAAAFVLLLSVEWAQTARDWSAYGKVFASIPTVVLAGLWWLLTERARVRSRVPDPGGSPEAG
jgi:hypothetical protein